MSKWTLRQQRAQDLRRGERQEHTAAMRAARYVRRHAWQFHGAGVEDAVRVLTPLELGVGEFICVMKAMIPVDTGQLRARFGFPVQTEETAHGLTVVGWWYEEKYYLCDAHRLPGAVPVTASHVTASTACHNCGTRLLGPVVAPEPVCPDCSHAHVEGQRCTGGNGPFRCGCTS